jgi:hypothetical protein
MPTCFPCSRRCALSSLCPRVAVLGRSRAEQRCGRHRHRSHRFSSSARPRSVLLLLLQHLLVLLEAVSSPVSRAGSSFTEETGHSGRPVVNPPLTLAGTSSSPSIRRNGALGEPTSLPHLFPAKSGLLLAGFWSSLPAMAPEDYIASISIFPGSFP